MAAAARRRQIIDVSVTCGFPAKPVVREVPGALSGPWDTVEEQGTLQHRIPRELRGWLSQMPAHVGTVAFAATFGGGGRIAVATTPVAIGDHDHQRPRGAR
ncbi:hypothetical protein GORHZ_096_00210 [Gordonia rhizosphera NBRC 16068]|uniref:Uncharacterized protein n=1 Tax=Gordonia rhizosphera NBRC 16068 TaxID=1108045 RepID=K6W9B0_9ACTN|nr:hypothetical protein GORHZ_096_00210 [Gordonia rhizosphera NBRC 16068]